MPKYPNNIDLILNDDHYFSLIEKRGRKFLKIKQTKRFNNLSGMEVELMTDHVWTKTDKLFRISLKYYGTMDFWWVIGMLNKKPTDGHYNIGDKLYIPKNPTTIMEALS